jgi:hypothetical protein
MPAHSESHLTSPQKRTEHLAVIQLGQDGAEEFVKRTSKAAVLFYSPNDPGIHDLLQNFSEISATFDETGHSTLLSPKISMC